MITFNQLMGLITLILFVHALVIIPKSIGQLKGVYLETPDPFFGKFEADCKWKNGATHGIGIFTYIIIMPLLVLIFEQLMNRVNIIAAIIVLIIIIIPFDIHYHKKNPGYMLEAYYKNLEEDRIPKDTPIPDTDGRIKRVYKKIKEKIGK